MERFYELTFENRVDGLHSVIGRTTYVGTKSGAIKRAREFKKTLLEKEISRLPVYYEIKAIPECL